MPLLSIVPFATGPKSNGTRTGGRKEFFNSRLTAAMANGAALSGILSIPARASRGRLGSKQVTRKRLHRMRRGVHIDQFQRLSQPQNRE